MKYPRYPKYKDSGVEWLGDVPEGWSIKRLSSFFVERREKVNDTDYPPLSVGKFGVAPQIETAAKSDAGDNRKHVCIDDFVINSRSDRKGSSGTSKLEGSVSLIYIVLKPSSNTSANFVHYLFRSIPFQEEFYRYGKGIVADLWSTNFSEMKNIFLALPKIQEQQTIATFLDRETAKIDALIAEQEKLIALLAEKRQAVISHAVTKGLNPNAPMKDSGVEWLGQVPEGWKVFNFRRVITRIEQGWSPNASSEPCQNGEWGVLKISAVKFGRFAQEENKALIDDMLPIEAYQVFPGDLLLTRANTPNLVGDCCVVSENLHYNLMMSDLIYRIQLISRSSTCFFSYFLRSNAGRSQIKADARGSSMTMAKISQGHIKDWVVVMPPKEDQQAIVAYLDTETAKIDALIAEAQKAVELLKERRSALISAAVTGKIDVRGIPVTEAL